MIKTFASWLSEDAPTNVSAGEGVRGFGDVSGQPAGSISNYAAANAADSQRIASTITNTSDSVISYSGGDTEDQILRGKGGKGKKGGDAD